MKNNICFEPVSFYEFNDKSADCQSLIHLINLYLGEGIVGAEIGVEKATSLCTFLQMCPGIKKIYAVDNYQPYSDYFQIPYNKNKAAYSVDLKQSEINRFAAHHNVEYSGFKDKVIFLEKDSNLALNDIDDNSLDFIFLDTYLTVEQAENDINVWYPKVKNGGIFSGHDWRLPELQKTIIEFRKNKNINSKLSFFDNTWVWIKE